MLGPDGRVRHKVGLDGVPSRTRVSADGRYGATTTFVTGDSYAKPGEFSTRTLIIDMRRGESIADLETFTVSRDGSRRAMPPTCSSGASRSRATATASTRRWRPAGKTYLIAGQVSTRTARVIHDNVECPSLSPDGTRIGYKKLVGSDGTVALPRARPRLRRRRRAGGDAVGRRPARVAGRPQPALPRRRRHLDRAGGRQRRRRAATSRTRTRPRSSARPAARAG